ncbi:MAG: TylF/MycF/NovP-related O-methyltransferase [Acidobacteriota bacterium]|nr:TylF/MycF/NovP-related O-methyltransferase [Acidobacteriota bacterium]
MTTRDQQRHAALTALYARIAGVPGDIVELGVASGESIRIWLQLVAADTTHRRTVFGFDTFAGFPSFAPEDGPEAPTIGKRVGGETELRVRPLRADEVNAHGAQLIAGDITKTLPLALSSDMIGPVALVFCDADTYAPTKTALDVLWPRLSPGGLFVFDEYGHLAWPGETLAVDQWVECQPWDVKLERLTGDYAPTACITKPIK